MKAQAFNVLAVVLFLAAFSLLGVITEYLEGTAIGIGLVIFAITLVAAVASLIHANTIKEMLMREDRNALKFVISYRSPLLKEAKQFKTSDQIRLRKFIARLTKKNIDYELKVEET